MKALGIASAVLLALTLTFAVTLSVVSLMYYLNLDIAPQLVEEWPTVLRVTYLFWILTAFAALGWWTQRRRVAWMWPAQLVSVVGLILGATVLVEVLRS